MALAEESDKPVGEEFIDEWKNPRSGAVTYYCSLCGCQFDSKLIVTHAKGQGHRQQYKSYKSRETKEDHLINVKNKALCQTPSEFECIVDVVLACEKALKCVSDNFVQSGTANGNSEGNSGDVRNIQGVMRTGLFASGLMLAGESAVQLVLLSVDKPTVTLLHDVVNSLSNELPKKYDVLACENEASVVVTVQSTAAAAGLVSCIINVTSALMRTHPFHYYNEIAPADPYDVLPRAKCEDALRTVRQARWFEAKAFSIPYIDVVLRIFRDLSYNDPAWSPVSLWTLQVLTHKCLSSVDSSTLTPSRSLRLVLQSLASGILLPDSPGVYDPCEREPTDLCTTMSLQEREGVTVSAQHILRMLTFHKLSEVLGVNEDEDETAPQVSASSKRPSSDDEQDADVEKKKSRTDG